MTRPTFLDDPNTGSIGGLLTTQITGINDSGTITGFYSDSTSGVFRGFVASVPEPSSALLLCVGLTIAVGHARHLRKNKTVAR